MGDKDPIRVIVVFNSCLPCLIDDIPTVLLRNVFMLDWLWSLQFANRVCLLDAATSLGVGGDYARLAKETASIVRYCVYAFGIVDALKRCDDVRCLGGHI